MSVLVGAGPALRGRLRPIATLLLALVGAAGPAQAETAATAPDATPQAAPGASRSGTLADPLSLIEGSTAAWSASRTDAGCYLISPYRKDTSRLALGRHPTLGLGLFAVSFPLATRIDAIEPMMIHVNGQDINAQGRVIVANLVFVALSAPAIEAELAELQDTGALWMELRQTWIMHDGQGSRDAVAAYRSACAAADPPAAAVAGAPP